MAKSGLFQPVVDLIDGGFERVDDLAVGTAGHAVSDLISKMSLQFGADA